MPVPAPAVRELLVRHGVPTVPESFAHGPEEAVAAANGFGYPVVLKIASARHPHKTDVGGVSTHLDGPDAVRRAALRLADLLDRGEEGHLVVQPQIFGRELIAGIARDEFLGAVVLLGLGGVYAEVLDDVVVEAVPVGADQALEMLTRFPGHRLLEGVRGDGPVDTRAVADLVASLSRLAESEPEIAELDLNPVIADKAGCVAVDWRALTRQHGAAGKPASRLDYDLTPVLEPASVAVIGASSDETKLGGRIIRYLDRHGYQGPVWAVNTRRQVVRGREAAASLSELPEPPELVCVAVPADRVSETLVECGAVGVRAVIVHSSGFAEVGASGVARQEAIRATAEEHGVVLVGPNSNGVVNVGARVCAAFGMALEVDELMPGPVAIVSQSGAIASSLLSRAMAEGIGLSAWASTGNEAMVGAELFLEALLEDDRVGAVALFLETLRDPERFRRATRRAGLLSKPVTVFKTGRTREAQRAVASHTGSLTSEDRFYGAFFRSCGVLRVDHLEDLVDAAHLAATLPPPESNRVGVVTMSGGMGSVIADHAAERNLTLPPASESLRTRLGETLPWFSGLDNPFDATMVATSRPDLMAETVQLLGSSGEYDVLLVQLTTNADPGATEIAQRLTDVAARLRTPLLIGRFGAQAIAPTALRVYREAHVPISTEPARLVRLADLLVEHRRLSSHAREKG